MGSLVTLLSSLVISDIGGTVQRYKRNSVLWAIVGLLFFTAYVFLLVAGGIYLSTLTSPLMAALLLAGGSLVLGVVIIAIMSIVSARDRRIAEERRRASQAQTSIAIAAGLTLFRKNPLLAAGIAAALGTAIGIMRKPGSDKDD